MLTHCRNKSHSVCTCMCVHMGRLHDDSLHWRGPGSGKHILKKAVLTNPLHKRAPPIPRWHGRWLVGWPCLLACHEAPAVRERRGGLMYPPGTYRQWGWTHISWGNKKANWLIFINPKRHREWIPGWLLLHCAIHETCRPCGGNLYQELAALSLQKQRDWEWNQKGLVM